MNRGTWSVAAVAVALLAGQAFGQAWGPGGGGPVFVVDSNGRTVVWDANQWRKAASGTFPMELPAGRSHTVVPVDLLSLRPGAYRCRARLSSAGAVLADTTFTVYVLR